MLCQLNAGYLEILRQLSIFLDRNAIAKRLSAIHIAYQIDREDDVSFCAEPLLIRFSTTGACTRTADCGQRVLWPILAQWPG